VVNCAGLRKRVFPIIVGSLGPIDPIVRHPIYPDTWVSVQSLQYYYEFLNEKMNRDSRRSPYGMNMFDKIDPWLLGDYYKTLKASQQYAELLLSEHMLKEQKNTIKPLVNKLINGYFSHGYPITKNEAKKLGLNIADINADLSDTIMELFLEYESFFIQ
jgi:hypothetical protein